MKCTIQQVQSLENSQIKIKEVYNWFNFAIPELLHNFVDVHLHIFQKSQKQIKQSMPLDAGLILGLCPAN